MIRKSDCVGNGEKNPKYIKAIQWEQGEHNKQTQARS